jgi:probable H4MPT-linked C1 transfer pathway protein
MTATIGWDVGGAHLKLALTEGRRVIEVRQIPCPLWQGLDRLSAATDQGLSGWPLADSHALTMTGELVDLFADRPSGVRAILAAVAARIDRTPLSVYAGDGDFLSTAEAAAQPERVASANWHAVGRLVGRWLGDGLLVDIGSTTTDLVPVAVGMVKARGFSDAERLACDELVYTGVVRTPIMAVARHIAFAGERLGVMAEHFATMADVYRVLGLLPSHADQHATADGRGKSAAESRVRLARMIGRDAGAGDDRAWADLARHLMSRQLYTLEEAARRILSSLALPDTAPLIGAGVGRFLGDGLARRLGRTYRGFDALVSAAPPVAAMAADCAPAVAVALLRNGTPG